MLDGRIITFMSNEIKKPTQSLTVKILIAMALGVALGIVLNLIGTEGFIQTYLLNGLFKLGGAIFIASLKVLVVPLVLVSLICGTAALDDIKQIGKVGGRTLLLYMLTTAFAVTTALLVAIVIGPGKGFALHGGETFSVKEAPSLMDVLIGIFPTNPFASMVEGNMLQIIVIALLFGFALPHSGESGKRLIAFFQDLNEVIMKIVMLLMNLAPYGVFCLISKVFAEQGFDAILPLSKYFMVVVLALAIQTFGTYSFILKAFSGLNPKQFFKNIRDVLAFAFSTSSSNATVPVTLEVAEYRCGINNSIASFTVPLGATINMDGTAIMQGVATVFISQAYGIDIGLGGYLMVILTATLASIGTAGVPGVGLITLAMVLKQVNLPVEGIALIIGVDRLLDMLRTATNVTGDLVVSCIVAKKDKQLSEETFYAQNPGQK